MFAKTRHAGRISPVLAVLSVVVLVVAGSCWGSPTEQTVTLVQGTDGYAGCVSTWLNEADELNHGDDTSLYVRFNQNNNLDRVTLIYFNLADKLPNGACVKSASLRLYQHSEHNMSSLDWLKVGAYRLMRNWAEGAGNLTGATWSYSYPDHSVPWMVPGARGVNTAGAGDRHHTHHVTAPYVGIADSVATITKGARWVEWDITPSVQWWLGMPAENFGVALDWWHEGAEGEWHYDNSSGANMYSEKYADADYRPQLVIKYVIPSPEPAINLRLSEMILNYRTPDPGISFSEANGELLCSGTTSDNIWPANSCVTNYTINSSFETQIKVKLEQGIVGVNNGQFSLRIFRESNDQNIGLQAVGAGQKYYEISGVCQASGNGEYHDGVDYWASYWDGVYPYATTLSPACYFFAQTPENEAQTYLTWKLRYDKTNGMVYAYVNDVLVTYYSKVNLSNFRLAIDHSNDRTGIPTTVWTQFLDTAPPKPEPLTWASPPTATGVNSISMTATTATDDTPPVQYYFTETSGNFGGSSSGWVTNTQYADSSLLANTQYGYKVKARDNCTPPNVGEDSAVAQVYTHINRPSKCSTGQITATSVALEAIGSLPNIDQGLSGTQFKSGSLWTGEWKVGTISDKAIDLTPNTQYAFQVRARNGDGVATDWSSMIALARTLAAEPTAEAYNPVGSHAIQANWGANGNPAGTFYYCMEIETGKSSGWIKDTNWTLTGLQSGNTYKFQVKARNADGKETAFIDLGKVQTPITIGKAKQEPVGASVSLKKKIVTAVFNDIFFIMDDTEFGNPQGIAGIGVIRATGGIPPVITLGMKVNVTGQLGFNDSPFDEELVIKNANIQTAGLPGTPNPYGASNKWLGGAAFGSQPGVYNDVTSIPASLATGINTIGMLVTGWGAVNDGGLGGIDYIWIDDGSKLNDGAGQGIRVSLEPIGGRINPIPPYCSVIGIMRCMTVNNDGLQKNVRVLWPRNLRDIVDRN
ncbi:MAG: DNRLRE domain-containing protein [Armatimonadetes bacterium]|nr:DNRLRE domain-containing protein [Armatimonadota bacterium]